MVANFDGMVRRFGEMRLYLEKPYFFGVTIRFLFYGRRLDFFPLEKGQCDDLKSKDVESV